MFPSHVLECVNLCRTVTDVKLDLHTKVDINGINEVHIKHLRKLKKASQVQKESRPVKMSYRKKSD